MRATGITVAAPSDGTNDGIHTIEYRSIDNLFNIEETKSCAVMVDTQVPTAEDNADDAWHRAYELCSREAM